MGWIGAGHQQEKDCEEMGGGGGWRNGQSQEKYVQKTENSLFGGKLEYIQDTGCK